MCVIVLWTSWCGEGERGRLDAVKLVCDLNAILAVSDALADGSGCSADFPQQGSPSSTLLVMHRGGGTV